MDISQYKRNLIVKLLDLARNKKEALKKASQDAQDRANEAEGPMQSRYSTFKEEGQYLAGGLKIIYEELKSTENTIQQVLKEPIITSNSVGSLSIVEVEFEDESMATFFVFPFLGGEKIDDITIITPNAPLCNAIMNKEAGHQFSFRVGDKTKRGEVTNVQ